MLKWFLIISSLVLPIVPAFLFLNSQTNTDLLQTRQQYYFLIYWLVFGILAIYLNLRSARKGLIQENKLIFNCYMALSFIPAVFSGIWLFSGPYLHSGSFKIFLMASLLPLTILIIFSVLFAFKQSAISWVQIFVLSVVTIVITVIFFELVADHFLTPDLFGNDLTENSEDRSYWYIVSKLDEQKNNLANSYGFIGPEPAKDFIGTRVLIIGDSLPAASRSINFPKEAQSLFNTNHDSKENIEIINASMPGYSLEQIFRYYEDKLQLLEHDILILSFYIDDINRELRYRKNNYLYTPSWPEWMQDVYYQCYICQKLLNLFDFSDNTFLFYREHNYKEDFPETIKILEALQSISQARGVQFAVLNIPRFNWQGTLENESEYTFNEMHQQVNVWCEMNGVSYLDILPILVGKDISQYRISETDIHFNDAGHQLIGEELKKFIQGLRPR